MTRKTALSLLLVGFAAFLATLAITQHLGFSDSDWAGLARSECQRTYFYDDGLKAKCEARHSAGATRLTGVTAP